MAPPRTTDVLVVRHAQSVWNAANKWQGWADPPLSPLGEQQAADAGRRLASEPPFDAVASSDLRRARRSAELIAATAPIPGPVEVHFGLREYDVGEWSGMGRDEIERRWPGQLTRWRRGELAASPGGEPRRVFEARLLGALRSLAAAHPGQRVLAVCHGGAIGAISRRAGEELRHVGHLSGCWLQVTDGQPVVKAPVNLLGGPVPRPAEAAS